MRNRFLQIGLFCVLLCNFTLALAQESGKLKGTITDKNTKEGLFNAAVTLLDEDQKTPVAQRLTDFDGNYIISPITPGTYYVKVQAAGYGAQILGPVHIVPNKNTDLNTQMELPTKIEVTVIHIKDAAFDKNNETNEKSFDKKAVQKSPTGVTGVINSVASTYSNEGETPSINASRNYGTKYVVDGITMTGAPSISKNSIEDVTVVTGGIPAEYGDLTGGIISITTRGPSRNFSGGLEATTSQFIDPFGYNLLEGNLTGPLLMRRTKSDTNLHPVLGFFIGGSVSHLKVADPPAIDMYHVNDATLQSLKQTPLRSSPLGQGFVQNAEFVTKGDMVQSRVRPNTSSTGFTFNGKLNFKPSNNVNVVVGGTMDRSDRNAFVYSYTMFNYENNPQVIGDNYRGFVRFTQNFNTSGDEKALIKNAYYSIQADYTRSDQIVQDPIFKDDYFSYGYIGKFDRNYQPFYLNVTKKVDGKDVEARYLVGYGENGVKFTPGGKNPVLENYTQRYFELNDFDVFSLASVQAGGGLVNGMSPQNVYSLWAGVGAKYPAYSKSQTEQYSINATGSATVKNHDLKFGLQYQQNVNRYYSVGANQPVQGLWTLARQLANSHLTQLDTLHPIPLYDAQGNFKDTINYPWQIGKESNFDRNLRDYMIANHMTDANGRPVDEQSIINIDALKPSDLKLSMFSADELLNSGKSYVSYYGYDYLGNKTRGKTTVEDFLKNRTIGAYNPIYTAGYVQDKFEYHDIILRLGLRVDNFNANQLVLKDPYTLYPVKTVGEAQINGQPISAPGNIGKDYAVYVDDAFNPTKVVGYRNGKNWYDASGAEITDPSIIARSSRTGEIQPYLVNAEGATQKSELQLSKESFKSYVPQTNVMPRISFSFPISETAAFYANYDVLTVRPLVGNISTLDDYYYIANRSTETIANPALRPEKRINYELGFKQRLTQISALTLQARYGEMRDMIQLVQLNQAYPVTYTTLDNIDFGTVKGFTIGYDLKGQAVAGNGLNMSLNYTLQFAEGTGSSAGTSGNLIAAGYPNLRTPFPLDYDSRHAINAVFDYRLGEDDHYIGPVNSKGKKWLSNTGFSLILNTRSGTPYTLQNNATPTQEIGVSSRSSMVGSVNGARKPWQFRADIRIDKDFQLREGNIQQHKAPLYLNVFLLVQNILDTRNILGVYRYTGLPNDDGYLNSAQGMTETSGYAYPQAFRDQYLVKVNNPDNYTQPRFVRLGASINF